MNSTISNRFSKGNNETIQQGFGVRPSSVRWSTCANGSPRRNSIHTKRLRRMSTGPNEYLMMSHKASPSLVLDIDNEDDASLTKEIDLQTIQQRSSANTVNRKLDAYLDTEKPMRKLIRRVTIGTDAGIIVRPIVVEFDDDETTVVSSDNSSFDSCDTNSDNSSSCHEPSIPKRSVRFPMDNDGKVLCQEYYLSESDAETFRQCTKQELWWSKKDRLASRDAARERIHLRKELFPAYQAATIQLLTKFGGIDEIRLPPQLSSWNEAPPRSESDAVHIIARSSDTSRGLEKMLHRAIGIPPLKYRNSVRHLIATQHELKSYDCCSSLIVEMLASQYMHDTCGAVAMARLLAESDVIAAQLTEPTMFHI